MAYEETIYQALQRNNITFYTGVPDSFLKAFCAYIQVNAQKNEHVITANEGGAIALATGYHLATGNIGLVYLQNSGQGNTINPLTSLTDPEVYSIPLIMLIGWRGEPGKKDEPQHKKQGRITLQLLETLEIPHVFLPEKEEEAGDIITQAVQLARAGSKPCAIIVREGILSHSSTAEQKLPASPNTTVLTREEAINTVLSCLNTTDIVVSTTGMASREVFELRERKKEGHEKDFLTVGSMGHSSTIALGIALHKPSRKVVCLDGDGALIMHMGALAIIGTKKPKNLIHIVLNNYSHESVGGQPTAAEEINLSMIAQACGYTSTTTARTSEDIQTMIKNLKNNNGPSFIGILVQKGHRKDLGRPTTTPQENKNAFMRFVNT